MGEPKDTSGISVDGGTEDIFNTPEGLLSWFKLLIQRAGNLGKLSLNVVPWDSDSEELQRSLFGCLTHSNKLKDLTVAVDGWEEQEYFPSTGMLFTSILKDVPESSVASLVDLFPNVVHLTLQGVQHGFKLFQRLNGYPLRQQWVDIKSDFAITEAVSRLQLLEVFQLKPGLLNCSDDCFASGRHATEEAWIDWPGRAVKLGTGFHSDIRMYTWPYVAAKELFPLVKKNEPAKSLDVANFDIINLTKCCDVSVFFNLLDVQHVVFLVELVICEWRDKCLAINLVLALDMKTDGYTSSAEKWKIFCENREDYNKGAAPSQQSLEEIRPEYFEFDEFTALHPIPTDFSQPIDDLYTFQKHGVKVSVHFRFAEYM